MEVAIVILIVLALIFLILAALGKIPDFVWGFCLLLIFVLEHAPAFHALR